jgi:phosphohistidine phosphatase
MDLFFLRHGIAGDRGDWTGDDSLRPLTSKGRSQLAAAAKVMASLGLEFDAILTSPLVRARETAEIIAVRLGAIDRLQEEPQLEPGFDIGKLSSVLAGTGRGRTLLLVGHEPDFSRTISALVGGGNLVMKKGGLARVALADDQPLRGELLWLLPPKLLRRLT